ncbi:MAG TPA: hypothetical protein VJS92_15555 [Candidatus Polarisedimenticolaceae bacterium]|nr:hypothetical protein [Candidatus Polarisedimenticolaceae bacterium]
MTTLALVAAALLVAAASQPALALCGNAILFSTTGYIRTPGVPDSAGGVSPATVGVFWSLGQGNTALGAGADSGAWPAVESIGGTSSGWVTPSTAGAYIGYVPASGSATTWAADNRVDSCPSGAPDQTCMVAILQDSDATGRSFFTVLVDQGDANGNFLFDNGAGDLAALPKPHIVGSSRAGTTTTVNIGPTAADVTPGVVGSCASALPVVTGYRVYANIVPAGAPAPVNRNRAAGWLPVSPVTATNSPTSATLNCATPSEAYLATSLIFDSGFELQYVGANSTRVQCGPNLAEPIERPRIKPSAPITPRSGRSRN